MRDHVLSLSAWRALAACALIALTPTLQAAGANIAWVSFHPADETPSAAAATAGFTAAPDVEYTRLLRAAGHQVTRYVTTATPDSTLLNTFDLVIISRSVPSGNYQTAASTALWHGLTKPTILLGGYILRASRLGYTVGETIPDTTEVIRLTVNDLAHPIFTGVALDEFATMVNPYAHPVTYNAILQRGISVNTSPNVTGSTVLATVGNPTDPAFGGMIIGEFPASTLMGNATPDTTAAKRLVLLTGSREQGITSEGSGIFDLDTDGARIFLNAVNYLAGLPLTEPPPLISDLKPAPGTTQHYAPVGVSFRATTGDVLGLPAANISLVLNGADVSSALTVSGPVRERTVTYQGLTPNTDYTGIITVRDTGGRQTVVTFSFDTKPALPLPPEFAYPPGSAMASEPGLRARVVQTDVLPVLPANAARAEAQLAGTLIDPAVGSPYPNLATPSPDNPDGAYNVPLLNWNVEAGGVGPERGNFQAPDRPDEWIPGTIHNYNLATEIITCLDLAPGRYILGVNSDDGFVLSAGVHPRDALALPLSRFDGTRAAADTVVQLDVSTPGLYPFRLLYYQSDATGSVEFFSVDPYTGHRSLINDTAQPDAIRAWRRLNVPERAHVVSLDPAPNRTDVPLDSAITATLQDGGVQIQTGTVQMTFNGQPVAAQVTRTGDLVTARYTPSPALASDTPYEVHLTFTDSAATTRSIAYRFTTRFVPQPQTPGANVVWVSFHNADDEPSANALAAGFTQAPDVEYTQLLRAAGHTVTRYLTTATPDVSFLNTFDLVIVSRSVGSANFQTPESTALWHSITRPTLHLGGYLLRASRLGFTTGDTIPDVASTIRLQAANPLHPVFAGINLDPNGLMTRPYARVTSFNGTLQRGISVNTSPVVPGGTVLATVGTPGDPATGGMIIGEFPAGTTMGNPSADVTAGRRLVFLSGSREQGLAADAAGLYDLEADGARLFLNAVNYLAGLETTPPKIPLTATRASGGQIAVSWPEPGSASFTLQASPSLSTPDWQNVPESPVVADGVKTVTLSANGHTRFFRLIRP